MSPQTQSVAADSSAAIAKPPLTTKEQAKITRQRRVQGVGLAIVALLVGAVICAGIVAAPGSGVAASAEAIELYITAIAIGATSAVVIIGLLANSYRKQRLESRKPVDLS
ncbi:MAG: hypothetical protein KR126chlam2_00262 [Chlamydiae bacterium]|nr:hypothetical protein [Chlamydiota bacterium]